MDEWKPRAFPRGFVQGVALGALTALAIWLGGVFVDWRLRVLHAQGVVMPWEQPSR